MPFLIIIVVFLAIRQGYRQSGSGSFMASATLLLGLIGLYAGEWVYGAGLLALSFLVAGLSRPRYYYDADGYQYRR